ncbi:MAG: hypothetical protein ACI395_04780, partial [Candidatus Cryptobacteroides sp.]
MEHFRLSYILLIAALTSCVMQPEFITVEELGCEFPETEVASAECSHSFRIISNTDWTATLDGSDWVEFAQNPSERTISFSGDGTVDLNIRENGGQERKSVITVATSCRKIELVVIQENSSEGHFSFPQHNILISFVN